MRPRPNDGPGIDSKDGISTAVQCAGEVAVRSPGKTLRSQRSNQRLRRLDQLGVVVGDVADALRKSIGGPLVELAGW
jgi:hypothetical protein